MKLQIWYKTFFALSSPPLSHTVSNQGLRERDYTFFF